VFIVNTANVSRRTVIYFIALSPRTLHSTLLRRLTMLPLRSAIQLRVHADVAFENHSAVVLHVQ
jgi:hypothetical protein